MDRKKIIDGLEKEAMACGDYVQLPLWVYSSVLALLKEKEAVEPVKKNMVEITARYEFDCPCGSPLLIGQPYCADCGRLVEWE